MSASWWASGRILARLALLLGACLLLEGCVYLRLLELKHQFADFDRFFAVDDSDGLTLTLKKPVLETEDLAFFDLAPEKEIRLGVARRWHLRWIKDYTMPHERPEDYEVTADFIFAEDKLRRVHLPERIFAFMPKSLILSALRSLGHARVDQAKQSASAALSSSAGLPLTQADLLRFLGAPLDTQSRDDGRLLVHYRYTGVSASQPAGKIDFTFTLDPVTKTVLHLQGRMKHAVLEFDWPKPVAPAKSAPP
ncbi:MAG TPA: hypothetical protein VK717_05395 [Opitutaceae bacterium]|jgi:hypothetical protein|nr:hypothetical protein [Opitutaceae bacterium]